jgi:hypothetical protein
LADWIRLEETSEVLTNWIRYEETSEVLTDWIRPGFEVNQLIRPVIYCVLVRCGFHVLVLSYTTYIS